MATATAAGYSGTPLARKLGVREHQRMLVVDAPAAYRRLLDPLPAGVVLVARASPEVDLVHAFFDRRAGLAAALASYRESLAADAALWVSWPKRSSKVDTDITEDVVRELALPLGWVDVKVCAVDDTWSALKLVVRKALR